MALPRNKHQQKTEQTRRKLLSAAMRVFSRDGFERSRLQDIAAEAGYTRGALYANYASKEDLFIALLEEQSVLRISKIADAVASTEGTTAYQSAIRSYYISRANDRQWTLLTLEFKLYVLRHKQHRAKFAAAYRRIREAVPNLLKMMNLDQNGLQMPERHTKVLLGVILNGLLLEQACDPQQVSSQEVIFLLGRMFDLLTLSS